MCAYYFYLAETMLGHPNFLGGRYAFLTQLTHTLIMAYFGFMLVCDASTLFGSSASRSSSNTALRVIGDYLFTVSFVFAWLVGVIFWALFLYDQELILPRSYQAHYPLELNLFQHGGVVLLMCLEAVICPHSNQSLVSEFLMVLLLGLSYLGWTLLGVHLNGGRWPYAFQSKMDLSGHALFNLVGAAIMLATFVLSRLARWLFNPSEVVHTTKQQNTNSKKRN